MRTRDDELLDVLAATLAPARDVEPSWAEISQFHRVIDTGQRRQPRRSPVWRIRRPLSAAVAGLFVLGGASVAAALSGAVMPEPVRVAARVVGLPVDSPQLADARAAVARLRDALDHQPRDLHAVRSAARDVRDELGRLSADDRAHVDAEASFLLAVADAVLAPAPAPLGAPPDAQPIEEAGGTSPAGTPTTPPADDHGRGEQTFDQNQGRATDDPHSGDDHGAGLVQPDGSAGSSGPGPSASSADGDHTATTVHTDNSGHGGSSSDGGGTSGSDGGSSDVSGRSSSDGGGHSGPG